MSETVLRYVDLEQRYGESMAYDLLLTIEKLTRIKDDMADALTDNEVRLQRAMDRLETINFSAVD